VEVAFSQRSPWAVVVVGSMPHYPWGAQRYLWITEGGWGFLPTRVARQ
jgi:hypothetical protein